MLKVLLAFEQSNFLSKWDFWCYENICLKDIEIIYVPFAI